MKRALVMTLLGAAGASALPQTAPDGAALYTTHCAVCHLADGAGQPGVAPALKGEHWSKLGAERAYLPNVLLYGLSGAIKVNGQTFVGVMAPFANLDDATLAAIATHVRKLQGAVKARPYAADDIKTVREKAGNPQATRQLRSQLLGP